MTTYICHRCANSVCVCAIDENEEPPEFCTNSGNKNIHWHPVKEEKDAKTEK